MKLTFKDIKIFEQQADCGLVIVFGEILFLVGICGGIRLST